MKFTLLKSLRFNLMERNRTISKFLAKTMFNGAIFISSNLVLICAEILLSCKCLENQHLPENQLKIRQKWLGKVQVLEPSSPRTYLIKTKIDEYI